MRRKRIVEARCRALMEMPITRHFLASIELVYLGISPNDNHSSREVAGYGLAWPSAALLNDGAAIAIVGGQINSAPRGRAISRTGMIPTMI